MGLRLSRVRQAARTGGSERDTADLLFVIFSFIAKAVPSNEYKYKKGKKSNSRNRRIQNGSNRIPFPPS